MEIREREVFIKELNVFVDDYYIEIFLEFIDGLFSFSIDNIDVYGVEHSEECYQLLDEEEMNEIVSDIYNILKNYQNVNISQFPFIKVKQDLIKVLEKYEKDKK